MGLATSSVSDWLTQLYILALADGPSPIGDIICSLCYVSCIFYILVFTPSMHYPAEIEETTEFIIDNSPVEIIVPEEPIIRESTDIAFDKTNNEYDPNPYKRKGEKKQNRENRKLGDRETIGAIISHICRKDILRVEIIKNLRLDTSMNLYYIEKWKCYLENIPHRSGIRLRFEKGVDSEIRRAVLDFVNWLRLNYEFPLRVNIYVYKSSKIKSKEGDLVYGTFLRPLNYGVEPYIRIASCDYKEATSIQEHDNMLATILFSIAHELTHYFQYINKIELTLKGEEIQATRYGRQIVYEYGWTRDHP